ncbi:MAG: hypothetical protein ACRDIY_17595 [Chloroflexota bacterium]
MPKKRLSKSSLLWFIRSRSYVSVPDIRRRFNLEGEDVSPVPGPQGHVFIGLPSDAARILGDLVRDGRVGLELQPEIHARAATGVYVIPHHNDRFTLPPEGEEDEAGGEPAAAS